MGNQFSSSAAARWSFAALTQWFVEGSRWYGSSGFRSNSKRFSAADEASFRDRSRLCGKAIIVTGANSGIGFEVARKLLSLGGEVHMVCRSREKGELARQDILRTMAAEVDTKEPSESATVATVAALSADDRLDSTEAAAAAPSRLHLHVCDLSSAPSVRAFAEEWNATGKPLFCLVNNAGLLPDKRRLTEDGKMEESWAVAMNQSFLLSALLLPALLKGAMNSASPPAASSAAVVSSSAPPLPAYPSRVITVSSGGGLNVKMRLGDLMNADSFDGTYQYAQAKRAQICMTEMIANKVNKAVEGVDPPVVFHSMHPGWTDTPGVAKSLPDFRKRQAGRLRSLEEGADTIVWLAASMAKAITAAGSNGEFWFDRSVARKHFPLADTRNTPQAYAELWAKCEEVAGWKFAGSEAEQRLQLAAQTIAAQSRAAP